MNEKNNCIIKDEINKCFNCKNKPCSIEGCPLKNSIPEFIHTDNEQEAFEILCETTVLPAICGRICPHSKQCQGACIHGKIDTSIKIGLIESYIGDKSIEENYKIKKEINKKLEGKKVAIIGSGPAGLTCAAFLAKKGINVTIYEKLAKLGGLLRYGIPDFRLDRSIIDKTIAKILELGIKANCNKEFGKDFNLKELTQKYDAVFIAIGANEPNITLDGKNVLSGNKLLEELNIINEENNTIKENEINKENTITNELEHNSYNTYNFNISKNQKTKESRMIPDFKGKNVIVSGGGNVAMDSARTLKKLGANVTVIYRRSEDEMPAEVEEIEAAKNERVKFNFKTNILKVDSEHNKIECIKTELVKKENETRLYPINIEGSNFKTDADYVVLATGSKTNNNLLQQEGLEVDKYGYIIVDENYRTSKKKVFAGGDLIGNKATVAWAARSGRNAAEKIAETLSNID